MRFGTDYGRQRSVATLAALQAGIEPAALALLALNAAVAPAQFGLIVGAGQAGMAAGAALCWRFARLARREAALAAAAGAALASLLLACAEGLAAVLVLRAALGLAMGLLLTRATAQAARDRPHHAIGTILLGQQLLSTVTMAALPAVAGLWGASVALGALTAAPVLIAWLIVNETDQAKVSRDADVGVARATGPIRLRSRRAMALVIGATMMIWSYVGAIGETAGLAAETIGMAIAIGSLASIPAAILASAGAPRAQPGVTLAICGAAMLAPMMLPEQSGFGACIAAMALFNGGSTFAMIRALAWASEGRTPEAERRYVLMIQCLAMCAGPLIGAGAMTVGGLAAIMLVSVIALTVAALAFAPVESLSESMRRVPLGGLDPAYGKRPAGSFARSA